jgi:hypothetical protein
MVQFKITFPDTNFVQNHHQNIVRNISQLVAHFSTDLGGINEPELSQQCRVNKKYDIDAHVSEMSLEYELSNVMRKTTFKFHLQKNLLTFERVDKVN